MSAYAKGEKPRDLVAARGGAELGRVRSFTKESDGVDQHIGGFQVYKNPNGDTENYAKGKGGHKDIAKRQGDDKSKTPIKPRC